MARFLGGLLVLVALVGVVGSVATVGVVGYYTGDLPSLANLEAGSLQQASRIEDRNGTVLEELYHENRTVVPLAKVSPLLRQATIATEDRHFYEHQGVDYHRLAGALYVDMSRRSAAEGGSTITEQVVKNTVLSDQAQAKSVDRKIKELLLAEEMERRYSKDQILELYLNTINYGNGAFGVEAAAQTYFGKHASELNLAEASFLAGLPQLPNRYNPFGSADQQAAARARWKQVLDAMVAAGLARPADTSAAFASDLFKEMAQHRAVAGSGHDPRTAHFIDYIRQYLVTKYGEQQVYEGGLTVVTTLDLPTQLFADQTVKSGVAAQKAKGANTGALLAMDPKDGEILAMVGSADYGNAEIRGQVNLTGVDPSGYRPVGSSFKPYTYATALEAGMDTAATRVNDQDSVIDGHRYYDWDSRTEGMIPLRQALQESRNLPALWTYKQAGGARVVSTLRKLGITTPIESQDSLPTTLGTNSMSMVQHLAAYSAFDNGGSKVSPRAILKVTDRSGQVLESFDRAPARERVISPDLAYLTTDILRGPPRIYLGTGNLPIASKSGTTESWTGAYWIGYTPDLAVATYMAHIDAGDQCRSGFAQLADGFQPSGWFCPANVLWGEHVGLSVFKPFLEGYYSHRAWPAAWTPPGGIVTLQVCKADGSLAAPGTPADQSYPEIFMKGVGEPPPTGACAAKPSPSPTPAPASTPRTGAPVSGPPGSGLPAPGSPAPAPSPSPR